MPSSLAQNTSAATEFVVDLLLASLAFLESLRLADLTSSCWQEKRAAIAQCPIATGMGVMKRGKHAQSFRAEWHPIGIKNSVAVSIEGDGSNATVTNSGIVDVSYVISGVSS